MLKITREAFLIKCQRCGSHIGLFTKEEMAQQIIQLRHRPYKFCCDTCKQYLKDLAKGNKRPQPIWCANIKDTRNIALQREELVDIIKGWSYIEPTKEEEICIKKVSKKINRHTSSEQVIQLFEQELEKMQ